MNTIPRECQVIFYYNDDGTAVYTLMIEKSAYDAVVADNVRLTKELLCYGDLFQGLGELTAKTLQSLEESRK